MEAFRYIRETRLGLTTQEFGALIGNSASTVSRTERGRRHNPTTVVLYHLFLTDIPLQIGAALELWCKRKPYNKEQVAFLMRVAKRHLRRQQYLAWEDKMKAAWPEFFPLPEERPRGKKKEKTALVADDSTDMRRMVSAILRKEGFRVTEAKHGQDAREKAQRRTFDLFVTDLSMPHVDGFTLTKELRKSPGWERVPILVLTSDSRAHMEKACRDAGATGWLVKPFDPATLVELVGKVVR